MLTILNLLISMWGDLNDHLMSMRIFLLGVIYDMHNMSSKNHETSDYTYRFGYANRLALIACFLS